MQSLRHRRLPRAAAHGLVALIAASTGHAFAQGAASSPAPSERVQRDADSVYRWIMIHADKPKKAREEPKPSAGAAPAKPVHHAAKAEPPADKAKPAAAVASAAAEPTVAAAAPASAASVASSAPAAPAASSAETQVAAIPPPPAAAPAQEVIDPDEDDPLVLLRQVDPEFPAATMRRLHKGAVRVRFEVRADGSVDRAEVLKTSHSSLNTAATEAVAKWKFQPLRHAQSGVVDLQFDLE
jgi:TonB family protein